jgi:twitching motility protein PilT
MSFSPDDIIQLIREAETVGATEIHFKVPNKPLFRIEKSLLPTESPAVNPRNVIQVGQSILRMANRELPVANILHEEISFGLANRGRFHAILYRQRGSLAIQINLIPQAITSLEDLGIAAAEETLGTPGITLITGGPERFQALSSLVDRFNSRQRGCVITIERPLMFLHRDAMAAISQREVGIDTPSISMGLQSAARQRPDLIACTNIPDKESVIALLNAAEEGLQVIACVAAPQSALATSWLTRHFSNDSEYHVGERIKRTVKTIISVSGESGGSVEEQS